MTDSDIEYLSKEDILDLHEIVVESDDKAESGVRAEGTIEYVVDFIKHGTFGHKPESIHEKAFQLMRLLAANHGFVDGNKRTALNSTATFYSLNGYDFNYGEEIKAVLRLLAINEKFVDSEEVVNYFSEIAEEEGPAIASLEDLVVRMNKQLLDMLVEEGEIEDTEDGEITEITIMVEPSEGEGDQHRLDRWASLGHAARNIEDMPDINVAMEDQADSEEQNGYASEEQREDQ